jgi:hypothetical protein
MRSPSYGHIPRARERRAKEAAQELLFWCDRYPEYAHHVQHRAEVILADAGSTPRSDRGLVLSALEQGCAYAREIMEELDRQLSRKRVNEALRYLVGRELVRAVEPVAAAGGGDLKALQYFLTHKNPFKEIEAEELVPERNSKREVLEPGRRAYQ